MNVVVCDAGLGNLMNVVRAVERSAPDGARVSLSRDPEAVRAADAVVFPGQGAFRDCARALADGLGDALTEQIRRGTPYVGICLGLQILFERSEEAPDARGLGVLAGDVRRLRPGTDELGRPAKLPHVGWNAASRTDACAHPIEAAFDGDPYFYFVHSFAAHPTDAAVVAATAHYGEDFTAAVARDNVFACQFHPEKSQRAGLELLSRALRSLR
ncbi:MAG: imidazole glycerol phosphate synthase subunit HisH [Polyangiaceae bacterium]